MLNKIFTAAALTVTAAVLAREVLLNDFAMLEEVQKDGWIAQSTATLSMPSPCVLRTVGGDQKRCCGMRHAKLLTLSAPVQVVPTVMPGVPSVKLENDAVRFIFSTKTGALLAVEDRRHGKFAVTRTANHYFALRKSGDTEVWETSDQVQSQKDDGTTLEFVCINPELPCIEIVKRYRLDGNRLRRTLCFRNTGNDTLYLVLRTKITFAPDFYQDGFYLGSGYVGPLMPVPKLSEPQRETAFLQTSKAMVLYHDGAPGSFAHYRTHLNGKFVFPWWQSAIRTYQEEPNALYYHPDGWEMALGTIDVSPGKTFVVDDCFVFFDGNWHTFLNDIYPNDPVVKQHLATLAPGPAWLDDVKVNYNGNRAGNIQRLRKLALLLDDEGEVIHSFGFIAGNWGDYHFDTPKPGFGGGSATREELLEYFTKIRQLMPKYRLGIYNWISSAMIDSDIFQKHPEYFLIKDRSGRDKNLFPGNYVFNYPTMINRPDAAEFMLSNFQYLIDHFKVDFIYLDETKTISLIDWEKGDLMRDDHWADFWQKMHRMGQKHQVLMFGNGRGNPHFELNNIEARGQLAPNYWRKFCGMAMAVANFVNHRPGGRVALLYWNSGMDYIPRVLANGFIPVINTLNYQQIPYVSASYELGKSSICDLAYVPDWKNDPETELESYCIQRDPGGEVVFSVINRSNSDTAQVRIDTAKLPLHLTVWCCRVRKYQDAAAKYGFGERERRSNYLATGWREGLITRPELLYSGDKPGKLEVVLKDFPKDEFAQIIIAPVPGGIYSVDGQPCNYFFATTRKVALSSDGETLTIRSQAEHAEIILPRPPGRYMVNGQNVVSRLVRFGERLFAVLEVPRGESTIQREGDAEFPSAPFTAKLEQGQLALTGTPGYVTIHDENGFLLYCGNAPKLPEYHDAANLVLNTLDGKHPVKLAINSGKPSPAMLVPEEPLHPAKLTQQPLTEPRSLDGARILESACYTSQWRNASGFQSALEPFAIEAAPATLTLTAGTTRKVMDYNGHTAAGFLLDNARKVELELSTTFPHGGGIIRTHTNRYQSNPAEFAGIMLDFQTQDGAFVRKALSVGVLSTQNPRPGGHAYGANTPAQEIYELGNFVAQDAIQHFTLDLAALAPEHWNGKVYLSCATSLVNPDRRITLKLLHANDAAKAKTIAPVDRTGFARTAAVPRTIRAPRLSGTVDCDRLLREAPLPQRFLKLGLSGYADTPCHGGISMDNRKLYAAFAAEAPGERLQTEFWCVGADSTLWQVIAYSDGTHLLTRNLVPVAKDGVEVVVQEGQKFLFAIPLALLGTPAEGQTWRVNLACYREASKHSSAEHMTYSPLVKSFNEQEHFAQLLPAASQVTVLNLGISGYTTGNIRNNTLAKALAAKPAVIVLLAGTNDMLNSKKLATFEEFEHNLRFLVQSLKESGSAVVMNTLPPCSEALLLARHKRENYGVFSPSERIDRANAIIRKVAADSQCEVVDLHKIIADSGAPDSAESLLRNPLNVQSRDGVHLRKEGYRLWAEQLAKTDALRKLRPGQTVVCLGDSITYGAHLPGAGTTAGDNMPSYLREELNH